MAQPISPFAGQVLQNLIQYGALPLNYAPLWSFPFQSLSQQGHLLLSAALSR